MLNISKNAVEKSTTTTADLEAPGSLYGVGKSRSARIRKGDLDRPGVVEKSDEVERMLKSMSGDLS